MTYIRQFDAIRAFAVILVIIWHWFPYSALRVFPLGSIGVDIFFVLSGFLITRILLVKKIALEQPGKKESKIGAIGKFMMRRSLRIFPIYYLMLLVLYAGANYLPNPIPVDWEYYVLYVENFLFYAKQAFPGGKVSPFWSLAVEEQFYLIWPWLLFFTPSRYIKHVLISGIVIGAACSFLFPLLLSKKELTAVLTPTCLQAFCLGGLLSFLAVYKEKQLQHFYPSIKILGIVSLVAYILIKLFFASFDFMDRTLMAMFTTWVLSVILLRKTGRFSKILDNAWLVAIGRVSYGVYVYHNFIPVSCKAVLHAAGKQVESGVWIQGIQFIETNGWAFYSLCAIILFLVAFSSYYFIEKPLLGLKKYFD